MKSTFYTTSVLALMLYTSQAHAVPFSFSAGQPARAADVNANFVDVENKIQTNSTSIIANATAIDLLSETVANNAAAIAALPAEVSYDYRNYSASANITSKVFSFMNANLSCDTETQNFARATQGSTTTITQTRIRTAAGNPCTYHVYTMQSSPTGFYMLSESAYTSDGTVLNFTITLDNPVLLRSVDMRLGKTIADAATSTATNLTPTFGTYVEKTTLVAIESVTVPYNGGTTYDNCLKLHTSREASIGFGPGELNRISWYCAGVGFVKGIQGANGASWVLTDIVYAP